MLSKQNKISRIYAKKPAVVSQSVVFWDKTYQSPKLEYIANVNTPKYLDI